MTERKGDTAIYSRGRVYYIEGVGILFDWGKTVPPDGTADYAIGAVFQHIDGGAATCLYVNEGSLTSCDFNAASSAAAAALEVALALATTPGGASKVGVFDTTGYWTAATVEAILAELGELLFVNSGTAALSGPSPLIWSGAPLLDVMLDPTKGFHYFTDFLEFGGLSLAANGSDHGLTLVERTDGTLANDPAIPGGIMALSSVNNTADQGGTLQILGCQCEPKDGTTIRIEWRAMVSEDGGQCFMGLCDDAMTAPVDANDAIVANNLAGFYRDTGTGDADWTTGCADGASADELDDAATSVKTTYHKYGMVISGIGAVAGSTIKFYFDGVLVDTISDITDIPLLLMCPCFQMDGDGTDIVTMRIDWLRVLVSHATGLCREATA